MSPSDKRPLLDYFADLEDPRIDRTKHHPLINVVFISICATVAGAEGWTDMETFGQSKRRWLSQFLDLSGGIPSDDTFRRVISRLDPDAFEQRFRQWTAAVARRVGQSEGDQIALDGKTLRGSVDRDQDTTDRRGKPKAPLHLVSAWASEQRLTLAQETVGEKTNEISALPDILEVLELSGCLVTIDGAQKFLRNGHAERHCRADQGGRRGLRFGAKEQPSKTLWGREVLFRRRG